MTDPRSSKDLLSRIMAYHDQTLSHKEIQSLEAELRADPEKRQVFINMSQDISLIHGVLQDESHLQSIIPDLSTPPPISWRRPVAMIAAALIVVALFVYTTIQPHSVGRLTYAQAAQWHSESLVPNNQEVLTGFYHLTQGHIRLQMKQGTVVTIGAPSEFEIQKENNLVLTSGCISTVMAEGADPFRVFTKHLEVIDIGTAFGLQAEKDGSSNVVVFEGSVQVRSSQAPPLLLKRGDSAQSSATGQLRSDVFNAEPFTELWPLAKGIDQMSDLVEFIPPGPQRPLTDYRHNEKLFLMPERMNLKLNENLQVDLTPQTTNLPVQNRQTVLQAASTISSYIVFFNGQVTGPGQHQHIQGQITFAQPILGVIYSEDQLSQSDPRLGLKDITYPQKQGRGLVCNASDKYPHPLDSITIARDGHTIIFNLYTQQFMDQFRVIVNCE